MVRKGRMKMKRSEVRESAFLLTFEKLLNDDSVEEIIDIALEADVFDINNDAKQLFINVNSKGSELDEIIAKYSEKRQLSRIPKVSIALLRIAIYEIMYDDKVPVNVAISEAVILSKKYSFDTDVQFVNGVLGAFSRSREAV